MAPYTRNADSLKHKRQFELKQLLATKTRKAKKSKNPIARRPAKVKTKQQIEKRLEKQREKKRAQRLKIKSDPLRYAQYLEKDRERKQKTKSNVKIRGTGVLSERAVRAKKKNHKQWKQAYRLRKKQVKPSTAADVVNSMSSLSLDNNIVPTVNVGQQMSKQAIVANKKSCIKRRQCYYENYKLKTANLALSKKCEALRKKCNRIKGNKKKSTSSPRYTVRRFLSSKYTTNKEIEEKLIVAEVMRRQLQKSYLEQKDERSKRQFRCALAGKIVKKYRCINQVRTSIIPPYKKANFSNKQVLVNSRKAKVLCTQTQDQVAKFCNNNSNIDPSKAKFIKVNNEKVQKQYLLASKIDLHTKFNSEQQNQISYSTFCKYIPKNCVIPKVDARDTCACIVHQNFAFISSALHSKKIIEQNTTHKVVQSLVCPYQTVECFARKCEKCKGQEIQFNYSNVELSEKINYYKWIVKKETRISAKTKKNIVVTITSKQNFTCSIQELMDLFKVELIEFLSHEMRVFHQGKNFKKLNEVLQKNECSILMDFSQNYLCKYSEEVQSVHFGASRQQLTLHTGVFRTHEFSQGFATLSECLRHDAQAVFAHVCEILDHFLSKFPGIDTIHFASDGPSSQYKNKTLFFLITQCLPQKYPQLKKITYNYSEKHHGKGEADGIGAVVKRIGDDEVKYGADICNFDTFSSAVKKKSKKMYISSIDENKISTVDTLIDTSIKSFNGTRQMYQFTWTADNPYKVHFNSLSCFTCPPGQHCIHFSKGDLNYSRDEKKSLQNKDNKKRKNEVLEEIPKKKIRKNAKPVQEAPEPPSALRRSARVSLVKK